MRSRDRRIEIINSTLKIIGESGLSGLTTAKIAEQVNITEAALYRHFKSKNEILITSVKMIGKNLHTELESISNTETSASEKLLQILELHLKHIRQNNGIPRIIYSQEIHSEKVLRKELDLIISKYLKIVEIIIDRGKKEKQFVNSIDISVEAMRFLSIIQFTSFKYSLSGFNKNSIQNGKFLWNAFINSICR